MSVNINEETVVLNFTLMKRRHYTTSTYCNRKMNFYTVSSYLSSFDNIDNTNFNNEQNHIEKG